MKNNEIVEIWKAFYYEVDWYEFISLSERNKEDFLSIFSFYKFDNIEKEELLTYCDISNNLDAKTIAALSDASQEDVTLFAITDDGIYFKAPSTLQKIKWEYINSVEVNEDDTITFNQDEYLFDLNFPLLCVCDKSLLKNTKEFKAFINALNQMAEMAKSGVSSSEILYQKETPSSENKTVSSSPTKKKTSTNQIDLLEAELSKAMRDAIELVADNDSFEITVDEDNVGEVFSEGKSRQSNGIDLTVISRYEKKEEELQNAKSRLGEPSKLGTASYLSELLNKISADIKPIKETQKILQTLKQRWQKDAYELFLKACCANRRIDFGCNGFSITLSGSSENSLPGVYGTPDKVVEKFELSNLPEDVASDLTKLSKSLSIVWSNYVNKNSLLWIRVQRLTKNELQITGQTAEDIVAAAQRFIDNAQAEIKKSYDFETLSRKIDALESELKTLEIEKEKLLEKITDIDPILAAFMLPEDKLVYDSQ